MRKTGILLGFIAVIALAGGVSAGDKPWLDPQNCAMCKSLVAVPDLMMNMAWEHHNISNGIVSVTTVNEGYLDAYRAASEEMGETAKKVMSGEVTNVCGMCSALAGLMKKGAKPEYVMTHDGTIMLVTAQDPEIVGELHKWADHTNAELAKMVENQK